MAISLRKPVNAVGTRCQQQVDICRFPSFLSLPLLLPIQPCRWTANRNGVSSNSKNSALFPDPKPYSQLERHAWGLAIILDTVSYLQARSAKGWLRRGKESTLLVKQLEPGQQSNAFTHQSTCVYGTAFGVNYKVSNRGSANGRGPNWRRLRASVTEEENDRDRNTLITVLSRRVHWVSLTLTLPKLNPFTAGAGVGRGGSLGGWKLGRWEPGGWGWEHGGQGVPASVALVQSSDPKLTLVRGEF